MPDEPGDERRERADEADEAADQHGLAAVAVEVAPRPSRASPASIRTFGPCLTRNARPSLWPRKKLALSPSTQQNQARPISGTMSISPWPATTPPMITVNSPGRDQADEGAGLEERHRADERVGPRAERLGDVLDHLLGVRAAREQAARPDDQADGDEQRRPRSSRGRAACASRSRARRARPPTTSATIWPALTGGWLSSAAGAGHGWSRSAVTSASDDRAAAACSAAAAVGEDAERRRAGAGDARGERARVAERVELAAPARGAARAPRARGRSRAPPASSASGAAASARSAVRVEPRARRADPVGLAVDVGGRQALALRDEHERHRRQRERLDALARAGDERVARVDLARHVGADARADRAQRVARRAARRRCGWRRAAPRRRRRCRRRGRRRPGCACRSSRASGGRAPPSAARSAASARGGEVRAVDAGADDLVAGAVRRALRPSARRRARATRTASRARAARRRATSPTWRTRLTFAGARSRIGVARRMRPPRRHARALPVEQLGERGEVLRAPAARRATSGGWPSSASASRARSRSSGVAAGRERQRAGERLAPVRERGVDRAR